MQLGFAETRKLRRMMNTRNSLFLSFLESVKSFFAQMFARGGDWLIQNSIVYFAQLGIWGYVVAVVAGSTFNFLTSYYLKRNWAYHREQASTKWQDQIVGYGYLRLGVALVGFSITFVPLFFGVEFYVTSTIAFVVNTLLLLWLSPKYFIKG